MSSLVGAFFFSSSFSGSNVVYNMQPLTLGSLKLFSSPDLTWGSSGLTYTITLPSTLNGASYSKLVITEIVARLVSGTPGASATFGLNIAGNQPFSSRQLPPYGGGVDIGLVNLNVQNISATYKMANPGDTVVLSSGGTFSSPSVFGFDFIGYTL